MYPVLESQSCAEFLRAVLQAARKTRPNLTIEQYAGKLGIGASALKMILSGKRRLSIHQLHLVAQALRLSSAEIERLQTIALMEQSASPAERSFYLRKLKRKSKGGAARRIPITDSAPLKDPILLSLLVFLSDPSLLAQVTRQGGELDCGRIAELTGISHSKTEAMISRMRGCGYLRILAETRNPHFVFGKLSGSIPQKEYLKRLLSEALARVEGDYDNRRSRFFAITFPATQGELESLMAEVQAVFDRYIGDRNSKEQPTSISQACVQLFPLLELRQGAIVRSESDHS